MKKLVIFLLVVSNFTTSIFAQNYKIHRVERGETVAGIAKKYNVSEESIYKLNPDAKKGNIASTVLVIPTDAGANITLDAAVERFKTYRVKRQETLFSIAKENDITVEDIKKYNPYLYDNELGRGDRIQIPVFSKDKVVNYNETVQNSSFENLKHIVLPKEGKFGIAKKYGMTVEELEALNPDMGELKPGQLLNVKNPRAEASSTEENQYITYEVQPRETYYSLTRRFEVSKDALLELNPQLASGGLEAGMNIKIPAPASMKDTLAIPSAKKIDLKNYINNYDTKEIAVMLPFNLQKFEADSIDKRDVLKKDNVLRISLDFYSGVLAAIDSVEKLGIPVHVRVFDTRQSKQRVNEIIKSNDFSEVQAVLGPVLTANIEEASRLLLKDSIPVFSPLTGNEIKGGQNFFQTRPSNIMMEKALITYIDSLKEGKNIIILTDNEHSYLRSKLSYTFPSAKVVRQENPEYLQRQDLTALLDEEKENWVILESNELALISNATSYLNSLTGENEYNIRLFTSDKGEPYDDEVSNQYLSNLKFTYASIAKEFDIISSNNFIEAYMKDYGISPSKYAVRGFDITYDILLRLASADNNFYRAAAREGITEYVENKFSYHKKMIGGYYNDAVYLIQYEDNLKLKVLN